MKLDLGNKIRHFRRRDGRTQGNLAEALGVTAQAVSRWESGGSYPDMETIPAIANYFHISIDELFGYNNDREEKINSIIENAKKTLAHQGFVLYQGCLSEDVYESIEMLRAASEEFPNEPRILRWLAQALMMWGIHAHGLKAEVNETTGMMEEDEQHNAQNIFWQEAIEAYEKELKAELSTEAREKTIQQLTPLYCRMGQYDKAKVLANAQNSIAVSIT